MRKISILELIEWTYGKRSNLARKRTFWGKPRYTIASVMEALAKNPGFQALRYPSGRIYSLRGPEELTRAQIEEIVLENFKK